MKEQLNLFGKKTTMNNSTEYMSATAVIQAVPFNLTHFLLHKLEAETDFPKSVKFGGDNARRYFRRNEIEKWLKEKFGDGHINVKPKPARAPKRERAPRARS